MTAPQSSAAAGRTRVAVVYGGRSSEHAISCVSAGSILRNLDPERYDVIAVGITPEGSWVLTDGNPETIVDDIFACGADGLISEPFADYHRINRRHPDKILAGEGDNRILQTHDREAIRHGIELLEQGELLVVFPEGGRSPDGSLQPGNIGPALMAARAHVPIIPAALKETDKIMPRGKGGLHRGRVQVDYGEPISPDRFGGDHPDKAALQELTETVMQAIYALQQRQYERVGEVAPPRKVAQ